MSVLPQSSPIVSERTGRVPQRRSRRSSRSAGCLGSALILVFFLCVPNGAAGDAVPKTPILRFVNAEGESTPMTLAHLLESCPSNRIAVDDPYHERSIEYFAMSLRCVLDMGFAAEGGSESLRGESLLLRALDGYTRPVSGSDLLEPGAYVAFGEPDRMKNPEALPDFSPIGRLGVDPGPFYLVWALAHQNDPHTVPWPYQLTTIEVASFQKAFPRTVPVGLPGANAGWTGYGLFQRSCASCHSMNGEGGKVGPDLNVPRSIVEYRPVDQIKDYIRDPEATRYTNMPAHPDFSDADLAALVAYFRAMSERKQDPRRSGE